ncbi:FAD:protein FMN transferase [Moritella sp.]|uniref:FAD:protein FMN transferase n=1 Tax=Moritella sp. TaxID=78556 RepID=UPI001D45EB56|nr:FAD:protein FMN transferase [Moritella sp.]MCJ8350929.1 FAD:protein FMN transferase [Moritella sp.]NQZ40814.1 FAD:protein FMN transferase [Moritella sp.]
MSIKHAYVHRFMAMTVPCEVTLIASDSATLARNIEANTRRLEAKFNFYSDTSMLTETINQRSGKRVVIDTETRDILVKVREYSIATQNIFDITVGTVKTLLQNSAKTREQVYQDAVPYMGLAAWDIEDNILIMHFPITQLDLGGVIKEVAVDQAIAIVEQASGALINFGGDVRASGCKVDGSDFVVGVVNPHQQTQALFALPLRNQALTTSAHYARRQQFSDQESSHILASQDTHRQVISVTVVADSALQAGIMSTALTINPRLTVPEEIGFALIDEQLNVHQNTDFLLS